MLRISLCMSVAFLIAACASKSGKPEEPEPPQPVIKSISVIAATTPKVYTLENVSALQFLFPIAATFNYVDSKEKAKVFNEKLNAQGSNLGSELTQLVVDELRKQGYSVKVLDNVTRPGDYPDNIDYKNVDYGTDALLHVAFKEVGLYSSRTSVNYLPRVVIKGIFFVKGQKNNFYHQDIYYGADAKKGAYWSVVADESIFYPSFDNVIAKIDDVRATFGIGTALIGKKITMQIHEELNPVAR